MTQKQPTVKYVENLKPGVLTSSVCKNNIGSSIMKGSLGISITNKNLTKFKGCNNDGEKRDNDKKYIDNVRSCLYIIFKNVEDNYDSDNSNKDQKETVKGTAAVATLFQHRINIMSNTNSRKGLKYL